MIITVLAFIILASIFAYAAITLTRVRQALKIIRRSAKGTVGYNARPRTPHYRFLVLGDSTMFGAGLRDQANSMGGLLAARYPGSSVQTLAVNGTRVKDLGRQLEQSDNSHYDLMLIGAGGNDIAMF